MSRNAVARAARACLVVVVFVTLPAALLGGLTFAVGATGLDRAGSSAVADVDGGDSCVMMPASCSGPSPVTSVWLAGEAAVHVRLDDPLRAVPSYDRGTLTGAVVLLPSPPPRSA